MLGCVGKYWVSAGRGCGHKPPNPNPRHLKTIEKIPRENSVEKISTAATPDELRKTNH